VATGFVSDGGVRLAAGLVAIAPTSSGISTISLLLEYTLAGRAMAGDLDLAVSAVMVEPVICSPFIGHCRRDELRGGLARNMTHYAKTPTPPLRWGWAFKWRLFFCER